MRLVPLACALGLMLAPGLARAGTARENLAHFFEIEPAAVTQVAAFDLTGVAAYDRVVVGHWETPEGQPRAGAVLLDCDARRCLGTRVWLGAGEVDVVGLRDLRGKPGPLGGPAMVSRHEDWPTVLRGPTARPRWPVLVLETRDDKVTVGGSRFRGEVRGTERHHELVVISLRKADQRAPRILALRTMDLYPSGAGTTTSYRLERGGQRAGLDIVAREQREIENDSACLRPDPVEYRLVLTDGRYQKVDPDALRRGCH